MIENIPAEAISFIQFSLFVLPGYALLKGWGYNTKNSFDCFMNSLIFGAIFLGFFTLIGGNLEFPFGNSTNALGMLGYGLGLSTLSFIIGLGLRCSLKKCQLFEQFKQYIKSNCWIAFIIIIVILLLAIVVNHKSNNEAATDRENQAEDIYNQLQNNYKDWQTLERSAKTCDRSRMLLAQEYNRLSITHKEILNDIDNLNNLNSDSEILMSNIYYLKGWLNPAGGIKQDRQEAISPIVNCS